MTRYHDRQWIWVSGILISRQVITRRSQILTGILKSIRENAKDSGNFQNPAGNPFSRQEITKPFGNPQNLAGFLFSLQEFPFPSGKGSLLPEFRSFQADFPISQAAFDSLQVEFNMKAVCNETISARY